MNLQRILISVPSYYSSVYLPYIWGLLRAEAEKDKRLAKAYQWLKPIYKFDTPNELLKSYGLSEIDVLGLSCYDWNWEIQLEIARLIRHQNPHCLIVMGGPEVPYKNEDFFDKHPDIDIVVKQDGEITFAKILREKLAAHPNYYKISGLILQSSNEKLDTGAPEKPNLKLAISPYLNFPEYNTWAAKDREHFHIKAFWETNRGCPYQCSFCDWGSNNWPQFFSESKPKHLSEGNDLLRGNWSITAHDLFTGVSVVRKKLSWKDFPSYFLALVGRRYYRFDNLFFQDIQVSPHTVVYPIKLDGSLK